MSVDMGSDNYHRTMNEIKHKGNLPHELRNKTQGKFTTSTEEETNLYTLHAWTDL